MAKKANLSSSRPEGRNRPSRPHSDEQKRLRSVIDTAVDAIITIDDRGIIETVNPATERMFGYTAHELIGQNVTTLMPEPYRTEHDQYIQNYIRTGQAKVIGIGREVVARRKDGNTFPVDLTVSEFRIGGHRMFTGIIRDITARKQMETILFEKEEQMRSIVETAVDGIFTITENGTIDTVNRAALQIFGYRKEELIGKNVKILMPEPYHSEHDSYLKNYLETGDAKIIGIGREVLARRKDGVTFPIDLAVSEFHLENRRMFTGIVRDISARKRSEIRLRVEHEVTRILAGASSVTMAIQELLRAICTNLDFVAGEFFALEDKTNELRCTEIYISPQDFKEYESFALQRTFKSGVGMPGTVCVSKRPIWVADILQSPHFSRKETARRIGLRTGLGIPIGFKDVILGVITLFSKEERSPDEELLNMLSSIGIQIAQFIERKRVEEILRTFEEKVRQDEKLVILGMLASEISHEIGTPLNIISGRVELISNREQQNEQLQKELFIINQQIERITKIVRQHLKLLRKNEVDEKIELDALLRSLGTFFQPYMEKSNIKIDFSLKSTPAIRGNQDQMQQVFINLIMNAIQEMRDGGKLNIASDVIDVQQRKFAEVKIQDSGGGISADVIDRIFDPFFSTKHGSGGTGLGLAIVRDIIKRHNGEVLVETQEKQGTTFYVRIPADHQ